MRTSLTRFTILQSLLLPTVLVLGACTPATVASTSPQLSPPEQTATAVDQASQAARASATAATVSTTGVLRPVGSLNGGYPWVGLTSWDAVYRLYGGPGFHPGQPYTDRIYEELRHDGQLIELTDGDGVFIQGQEQGFYWVKFWSAPTRGGFVPELDKEAWVPASAIALLPPATQSTDVVSIYPLKGNLIGSASVVLRRDGSANLILDGVESPDSGKQYAVWVIPPGKPALRAGATAERYTNLPLRGASVGATIAITQEVGQVDAPTAQPVMSVVIRPQT